MVGSNRSDSDSDEHYQREDVVTPHRDEDDEIDELIVQAQDAFFENRYHQAVELCRSVLRQSESEPEVHELLTVSLQVLGDFDAAVLAAHQWIEKYGANLKNLRILLECNYLLARVPQLNHTIRELLDLYGRQVDPLPKSMALSVLSFSAALASDLGDRLDNVIALVQEAERDDRLELLLGWTQLKIGHVDDGFATLNRVIARRSDDDGIAAAFLVIYQLEAGDRDGAIAALDAHIEKEASFSSARPLHEIRPYVVGRLSDSEREARKIAAGVEAAEQTTPPSRRYSSIIIKRRMDYFYSRAR
jgi:tetratricopeptide (TPR) repeat protein